MTVQCLAGSACRAPHITADGKREGRFLDTDDNLCNPCLMHFRSAIKQLPDDWDELRAAVGERQISDGPKISSTPTPAMPISARKDALMANIVESTSRAAEIVADALNTSLPSGRTAPALKISERVAQALRIDAGMTTPQPDTAAWLAEQITRPGAWPTINAAVNLVEPHIDMLAGHGQDIDPEADDYDGQLDHRIWNASGEHIPGEPFEHVQMTGIDIVLDLVDLHNQTRAELGKTRLRRRLPMPCPHCDGRLGRDDGQIIVNCADCKASWTEREYKRLAGIIVDERQYVEILKQLLDEANARLDKVREQLNIIAELDNSILELPGSAKVIHESISEAIAGHPTPEQRQNESADRKATEQRQLDEDDWEWGEKPELYTPPRRKTKADPTPVEHPVHPGSLSTLVDLEVTVVNGCPVCPDCNLIHAGECA